MEKFEIIEFVEKAFDLRTEKEAFNDNPVLFALYEMVAGYIYERYEVTNVIHELRNMSSSFRDRFYKEKIVEHLCIRINQNKR